MDTWDDRRARLQDKQARVEQMASEVQRMVSGVGDLQKKVYGITATATSEDGLITATVGPRGQLIDLEIDAKIYRRPDSALLAQTILKTVKSAVDQGMGQMRELLEDFVPEEVAKGPAEKQMSMLKQDDAKLLRAQEADE